MVCMADSVVSAAATESSEDYQVASGREKGWRTDEDSGRWVPDDDLLIPLISILVDIADGMRHKRGLRTSRHLFPVRSVIRRIFDREDEQYF